MSLRKSLTACMVLAVLTSGSGSNQLARVLGRVDFGTAKTAVDDKRSGFQR